MFKIQQKGRKKIDVSPNTMHRDTGTEGEDETLQISWRSSIHPLLCT